MPLAFQKLHEVIFTMDKRACNAITPIVLAAFGQNFIDGFGRYTPMKRRIYEAEMFHFLSFQKNSGHVKS